MSHYIHILTFLYIYGACGQRQKEQRSKACKEQVQTACTASSAASTVELEQKESTRQTIPSQSSSTENCGLEFLLVFL